MENTKQKTVTSTSRPELLNFLPRMTLFPGEDENSFEDLHHALMLDLSPATPYETAIAENLIALEWELVRHRKIRDDIIQIEFRKVVTNVIATGTLGISLNKREADETDTLVKAYYSGSPEHRAEMLGHFTTLGITEGQILAKAYDHSMDSIVEHERKIQGIENRRRKLLDDYNKMKASRAKPIEDAVVLEAT